MTPEERLLAWGAAPTGAPWRTASSVLVPGVRGGVPVLLKVAEVEEERRGNRLMAWWSEHGGLPVLEADAESILMRRAEGPRDLLATSAAGRDAESDEVLLRTALVLHRLPPPPGSVGPLPLRIWFRDLVDRPQTDPLLVRAAAVAREVLGAGGPSVVLHGDLHHGNVLDLGGRWVAIDPKALLGDPAFDVANVFCNPTRAVASARLDARLERFADGLGIEQEALAAWVVAWCGLSLAWSGGGARRASAAREVATGLLPRLR